MDKQRILIIDDTPANIMTLGSSLAEDFELQVTTCSEDGIALANELVPDLILLDIMMPRIDGYETFRRIRANPALRSIPVIFLTAMHGDAAQATGLGLGAADYITKPINVAIARQRIKNLLERENLRREVEDQRQQLVKQLKILAYYDPLTKLPNRVLLSDRLNQSLAKAQRQGTQLSVIFLNLDGFTEINHGHGREVGDQLLISVATRMRQTLRGGDTLARLGGDDFVAVLHGATAIANPAPMVERLLTAVAQPIEIGSVTLQVSVSMGLACCAPTQIASAEQLIREANQAMYQAKSSGKNKYVFFDPAIDRERRQWHEKREEIQHALHNGEFLMYYQPKVNMREGRVTGAEALIRWKQPQGGLRSPLEFLPFIENHPLSIEVGEWVIHTVLNQIDSWQRVGLEMPVSINIDNYHLQQSDFVERLRFMLSQHPNVKPACLEIEILETSEIKDLSQMSRVIQNCGEFGVRFSLDDFGTGYSSMAYLKNLPVYQFKIDKSFVISILDNPDDLAIIEGVIALARTFRRQIIAEGVETADHGAKLLELGCDHAQGLGIARPMPANELPAWTLAWRSNPAWLH